MLKLYKQIHACKRHSTGTHTRKYIYGSTYVQPNTHFTQPYTQIIHPFLTEYEYNIYTDIYQQNMHMH